MAKWATVPDELDLPPPPTPFRVVRKFTRAWGNLHATKQLAVAATATDVRIKEGNRSKEVMKKKKAHL